jgi:hypothetical protein
MPPGCGRSEHWRRASQRGSKDGWSAPTVGEFVEAHSPPRSLVEFVARKTPEERAAIGLPEVGWEEELLRRGLL